MGKLEERIHAERRNLLGEVAKEFGEPEPLVISYIAEPQSGILHEGDVELLEDLLQASPKPSRLMLIIDSPGGSARAAEQMIRVCRVYAGGKFSIIVPKAAKSAATLVCLGAERIYMGPAAELGPVDPQIQQPGKQGTIAAWSYVNAYRRLMAQAESAKGKVDGYLQQLGQFDPVTVEEFEREIELSKKVAQDALF
jgi:ClpP class serine protease